MGKAFRACTLFLDVELRRMRRVGCDKHCSRLAATQPAYYATPCLSSNNLPQSDAGVIISVQKLADERLGRRQCVDDRQTGAGRFGELHVIRVPAPQHEVRLLSMWIKEPETRHQ